MLIVRENTEGEYVGSGCRLYVGTPAETATHTSIFTRRGIERAVEHAFAAVPDGGLVTSVTKSNALPHTMGLWDEVTTEVAARHPDTRWERMHVDAVAVANPLGAINSAAMLLDHLGRTAAAELVRTAVDATLSAGVTPADLGGTRSTREMGDAVLERIATRTA